MHKFFLCTLCLLTTFGGWLASAETLRVLTDRTEGHIKPVLEQFTKTTGIAVEAVYVGKGLLPRLQAQPTEADVIITKTAENLERARLESLLAPITAQGVLALNEKYLSPDRTYVTTSYRSRGIYVSKDRVAEGAVQTYQDLLKPEFTGRLAIRSGFHDYNVSLWCQMAEAEGIEATRAFLTGLKGQLARAPKSNDRGQVQAIQQNIADVSIGNHYYQGIMLTIDEQRPWAEAARVVIPNQQAGGTYIMRAAAGLTKANRHVEEANALLDFIISEPAQTYFAQALYVYPVLESVPLNPIIAEMSGGTLPKCNFIQLQDIDKHREAVIAILTELNFDVP